MSSHITINDVKRRYDSLSSVKDITRPDIVYENKCLKAIERKNPTELMRCIEGSNKVLVDMNVLCDCFEALGEVGTIGQIQKAKHYLMEVQTKRRNAFALANLFKQRLGRVKKKNTSKLTKKFDSIFNNVGASIHSIKKVGSPAPKREQAIEAVYEQLIDHSLQLIHCDRILENYGSISKRFNLDKLFIENVYANSIEDTINELCHLVDTYDMSDQIKLNTVIECGWYGLKSNHIIFSMEQVLVPACEYFLMKDNGRYDCKTILENSILVYPDDRKKVDYIVIDDKEEKDKIEETAQLAIEAYTNKYDFEVQNIIDQYAPIREETDFQKIFDDFKKNNPDSSQPEKKLSILIRRLYSKNVDNVVEGTPDLLAWIRRIFILGTCAIHPVVAGVLLIANEFIAIHAERKDVEKMLKAFQKEKEHAEKKLESTKNDEEKERLEEYIDALDDAIDKVDGYQNTILTDNELDKKYDSDSDSVDSFKTIFTDEDEESNDDDDDFDLSDEDFEKMFEDMEDFDNEDISEAAKFIPYLDRLCEEFLTAKKQLDSINLYKVINKFSDDNLKNLSEFVAMHPECMNPESTSHYIECFYNEIKKNTINYPNKFQKYKMMNACNESITTLKESKPEMISTYIPDTCFQMYNMVRGMKAINNIVAFSESGDYVLEASITNQLKLAGENLRKAIVGLSDKEKSMSKSIDSSMSALKKSIERGLTNDSREAVISGSIIPSASKVIKLAITTGLAWMVSPALAVIGALGYFACSAALQERERRKIIDEIEIELKMCAKYIETAEASGDNKALKQLYTIQRDLERQRQKIKYKMDIKGIKNINPKDMNRQGVDDSMVNSYNQNS